jgi:hypothetical protein
MLKESSDQELKAVCEAVLSEVRPRTSQETAQIFRKVNAATRTDEGAEFRTKGL